MPLSNAKNVNASDLTEAAILYEHKKIHDGDAYSLSAIITLGSGASMNVSLEQPINTQSHIRHFELICDSAPVQALYYQGPTITIPGIDYPAVNKNDNYSSKTPQLIIKSGVTFGALGQFKDSVLAAGTNNTGGFGDGFPDEWVTKGGESYAIVITNNAASASNIHFSMFFYE